MPQAIAAVVGWLGFTGTAATVITSLVQLGVGIALTPRPRGGGQGPGAEPQDGRVMFTRSIGDRVKRYGRNLVAGQVVFGRAGGAGALASDPAPAPLADGQFLHRIVVHGHGLANRIIEYRLDGRRRRVESDGRVLSAEYAHGLGGSVLRIESRLGEVPGLPYAGPVDAAPEWGAAHRLDGLVTSYIRCEQRPSADMQQSYPSGPTELQVLAEFSRVIDPRVGAPIYTDNAALVIADWIESPDGFGATGALHVPDLIAAADRADVLRQLSNGGSLPMWRLAGSAALSEPPEAPLRRMLDASAADLRLRPDGSWSLNVGPDPDPVVTLTEAQLLEVLQQDDGPGATQRYTTLPATYVDEALDFAETSADPFVLEAEVARLGGEFPGGALDLRMAPYHAQARHAAKIRALRDNPPRRLRARFRPSAIEAIYERTVRLDLPGFGLSGVWRVEPFGVSLTDLTVTLDLRQIDPAAQAWALGDEGQPLELPPEQPDPDRPPQQPVGVQAFGDGVAGDAGIFVAFDPATDPQVQSYVAISPAGADSWSLASMVSGQSAARAEALTDGNFFDVAVVNFRLPPGSPPPPPGDAPLGITFNEFLNSVAAALGGVADPNFLEPSDPDDPPFVADPAASDVTALVVRNVQALAVAADPGVITALAVVPLSAPGLVEVTLVAPETAALRFVEVLRDGLVVARTRALPGAQVRLIDQPGPGLFAWTARAVSLSGATGPISAPVGASAR